MDSQAKICYGSPEAHDKPEPVSTLGSHVIWVKNGLLWKDVKFSLTYDGELLSASDKHSRLANKNRIRFALSAQLWNIYCAANFSRFQLDEETVVAATRWIKDITFFPLLTREMKSSCSLAIKFMRNEQAGQIVHGGDMDNRLKTLFDALRMPENDNKVLPDLMSESALKNEKGCVCLLEDDSLITDLSVATISIMTPLQRNHVRLVIDVEFRPSDFV
jgi:hypothetical protein